MVVAAICSQDTCCGCRAAAESEPVKQAATAVAPAAGAWSSCGRHCESGLVVALPIAAGECLER